MDMALAMARRGLGQTAPNPSVGAVIADERRGVILARGWTQPGGRPHAETEAIARAGAAARGASLYVTLEPCSHHGKTPPCADAIIAAGLRRVVCAIEDPDPRVAGRGLERLRNAGVVVERGLRAEAAHWLTRGHIKRVTERRPSVQLKLAVGADGTVPLGSGQGPTWVTGALARAHGALLRAEADAIMVGSGTVVADDPALTCRLPGLAGRSPLRVVLGGRQPLESSRQLVRTAGSVPVLLFVAQDGVAVAQAALGESAVEVEGVPRVAGQLWIPAVLEVLVARGVTRLLVEGGGALWRSFAAAGVVDEVVLYRAGGGMPSGVGRVELAVRDLRRLVPGTSLQIALQRRIGDDDIFVFRNARGV